MAARTRIPKSMIDAQRQVLTLQRSLFERTYRALADLQAQQQAVTDRILARLPGDAPLEELVDTWRTASDDSRAQYKQAIDESFSALEEYLEQLDRKNRASSAASRTKTRRKKARKSKTTRSASRPKPAKKAAKKATKKKATKKKATKKKASKKKAAKKR